MALNKVALDTNIAIEILNNNSVTIQSLHAFDMIYLPVVVCGELIYGAINSSRVRYNLSRYESFISDCEVLHANLDVSLKYASFKKSLKDTGCPIPENDIWIAAICATFEMPLFTRDGHFRSIKALELINRC
ncbi:type II toxin-antitoxin system VapC family toxin [Dyadobacter sp. CY343]|uniref:type II toxin-antitoxin system VapC family toxin n=1 Tax=Dyadobacter sp. CY343 TaxID=2907299 RepID=UPI0038D37AFF